MFYVALSLLFSLSWASPAYYRPSPAEYQETKAIALKIAGEYQQDGDHIVSIGRSPTVIMAFLKNLGLSNLSSLPLSKMNTYDDVQDLNKINKVYDHFKNFLPTHKQNRLLFIDYTFGGKAYFIQKSLIESYLRAYHPQIKFEFIALVSEKGEKLIAKLKENSVKPILLSSKSLPPYGPLLWDVLNEDGYQDWAEFKSFVAWRDRNPESNHAAFEEFRSLVRGEMLKDPQLKCRFLL